jgi:hypothetical protein
MMVGGVVSALGPEEPDLLRGRLPERKGKSRRARKSAGRTARRMFFVLLEKRGNPG